MRRLLVLTMVLAALLTGQPQKIVFTDQEKPIVDGIKGLRAVDDSKRGAVTTKLALDIRALPASPAKLMLAQSLANLSTEGDFGHKTLQEVGTTLAEALHQAAAASKTGMAEAPYVELASLVRYEGVKVPLDDPLLNAAMARLQADDQRRQNADFTLKDVSGVDWSLRGLKGKVVLVNFWATWCPPCRKEMPDLDALYKELKAKGLVILAISDEDAAKVNPFIAEHKYSYPILLDPSRKVNTLMGVEGIPKSFLYDREGKLVAQAIDMRTRGQLLAMLKKAGM